MWIFEKKMEFPVKIKNTNPALAKLIITQYGGCDGEVGAASAEHGGAKAAPPRL